MSDFSCMSQASYYEGVVRGTLRLCFSPEPDLFPNIVWQSHELTQNIWKWDQVFALWMGPVQALKMNCNWDIAKVPCPTKISTKKQGTVCAKMPAVVVVVFLNVLVLCFFFGVLQRIYFALAKKRGGVTKHLWRLWPPMAAYAIFFTIGGMAIYRRL